MRPDGKPVSNENEIPYHIFILGLARNCASSVHRLDTLVRTLSDSGTRLTCIIGENGSTDDTSARLHKLQQSHASFHVFNTAFMDRARTRMEKMAIGRQFLLNQALNKHNVSNCDFVVVLDLDNVLPENIGSNLLHHCEILGNNAEYFALSASTQPLYYDIFAFRDKFFMRNLDSEIRSFNGSKIRRKLHTLFTVHVMQSRIARVLRQKGHLDCISAFNGLTIYRSEDFFKGDYLGTNAFDMCEHITFHEAIHKRTRKFMRIVSGLKVDLPAEHAPGILRTIVRKRKS